jgi:hypothetical protein
MFKIQMILVGLIAALPPPASKARKPVRTISQTPACKMSRKALREKLSRLKSGGSQPL